MKQKKLITIVAVVLLLCSAVGGTLAWLSDQTPAVTNTFDPAQVSVSIQEDITTKQGEKSEIKLTNTSDIKAYVRAAVIVNWVDGDNHVVSGPAVDLPTVNSSGGWAIGRDGYYYYTWELNPGQQTPNAMFTTAISEPEGKPDDARLQVTILAEAIQSEPDHVVVDNWGSVTAVSENNVLTIQQPPVVQ